MEWLALACTAENELLAWSQNLSNLESACLGEFRAISRIYAVEGIHAQQLRNNNLDFKLKFDGPRNTILVPFKKELSLQALSLQLQNRVGLISELNQRLAHGFKRFSPQVEWQLEAYKEKYYQALRAMQDVSSDDIGMVQDYAEESNLAVQIAAGIIINKYENRIALIRKLERLRIRHQNTIRSATTKEHFAKCRSAMEEDSFLSMMM